MEYPKQLPKPALPSTDAEIHVIAFLHFIIAENIATSWQFCSNEHHLWTVQKRWVCLVVHLTLLRVIVLCDSEKSFAIEKMQRQSSFIHV